MGIDWLSLNKLGLAAIEESFDFLAGLTQLGLNGKTLFNRLWQMLSPVVSSFGNDGNDAFDFALEAEILVNWHKQLLASSLSRDMFLIDRAS